MEKIGLPLQRFSESLHLYGLFEWKDWYYIMTSTEKISVIIPVYNSAKYLERSLRSVMGQTYRNLEIICVNDGSTDSSPEILQSLAAEDSRIRIINQANAGQGAARNAGIEASTAAWLTFPDSDDLLVEDAYETAMKAVAEAEPDMVHFSMKVVSDADAQSCSKDSEYYSVNADGLCPVTDDMVCEADSSVSNKFFRRSIIERYNIRFEHIRYEDFQFSREYLSVAQNVYCISRPLYIYIRHAGSTMDQTFRGTVHSIDHLTAFAAVADFFDRNLQKPRALNLQARLFVSCYWLAVQYATDSSIPDVVRKAEAIYGGRLPLSHLIGRRYRYGTLCFYRKKPFHFVTEALEFLFSIRYEPHNYKPYKVMRLMGFPLSKVPVA